jgi:hypothetical protein
LRRRERTIQTDSPVLRARSRFAPFGRDATAAAGVPGALTGPRDPAVSGERATGRDVEAAAGIEPASRVLQTLAGRPSLLSTSAVEAAHVLLSWTEIEPASSPWKGEALPLSYRRARARHVHALVGEGDLNPRPPAPKAGARPRCATPRLFRSWPALPRSPGGVAAVRIPGGRPLPQAPQMAARRS